MGEEIKEKEEKAMKQKSLAEGLCRWPACDTHSPTLASKRRPEKGKVSGIMLPSKPS